MQSDLQKVNIAIREKALQWWMRLDYNTQEYLKKKYNLKVFGSYNSTQVLKEIEEIWRKENK